MVERIDVSVRDLHKSDIPFILDYWYRSPSGFIEGMGVDLNKLVPEEEMKSNLISKSDSQSNALVIEYCRKPVGFHTLFPYTVGDFGIFHAHIWDASVRGKGIATYSYMLACRIFVDRFNLKKVFFKTPVQNKGAIRVKEKLGIRSLGEEEIGFGIIRDGTVAQVFELTKEEIYEGL